MQVVSINVSGHKYGLVYPGVGWAIWRDPEFLPKGTPHPPPNRKKNTPTNPLSQNSSSTSTTSAPTKPLSR